MRALLFLVAVNAGCCKKVVYDAGQPIHVALDAAFDQVVELEDGRQLQERELVLEGLRFWNVVGVQVVEGHDAAAVPIRRFPPDAVRDGEYHFDTGEIEIDVFWGAQIARWDVAWLRTTAAHELGHALGLCWEKHLAEDDAVMNAAPRPLDALSAADVEAFWSQAQH
jgi:hypothetical protein